MTTNQAVPTSDKSSYTKNDDHKRYWIFEMMLFSYSTEKKKSASADGNFLLCSP